MISHQDKLIFIHIPKCAGTSIENAFGHSDDVQLVGSQDHRSVRMIEQPIPYFQSIRSLENQKEIARRLKYRFEKTSNERNRLRLTANQFQTYFKFAFVRNPWDRAWSWYKNVIRDSNHQRSLNVSPETSFSVFLNQHIGSGMLKSQTYWLKNFQGKIDLDFIGRFENLKCDFEKMCRQLGKPELELPHKLSGGNSSGYLEGHDAETRRMVADFYQDEIELFGYEFEPNSQPS